MSAWPRPSPDAGKVIDGRYRLAGPLAPGTHGDLWRAIDERLGRQVAIRVFRAGETDPARERAQVPRLARVSHPGLLNFLDAGVDHETWSQRRAYLVTELAPDATLRSELAVGPLAPDEVADLGVQLANALAHAHSHGLRHGRITSSNVMVVESVGPVGWTRPRVKLADLGLLDLLAGARSATSSVADVRALGYVLLQALTGQPVTAGVAASIASLGPRYRPWKRLLNAMTSAASPTGLTAREAARHLGRLVDPRDARPRAEHMTAFDGDAVDAVPLPVGRWYWPEHAGRHRVSGRRTGKRGKGWAAPRPDKAISRSNA